MDTSEEDGVLLLSSPLKPHNSILVIGKTFRSIPTKGMSVNDLNSIPGSHQGHQKPKVLSQEDPRETRYLNVTLVMPKAALFMNSRVGTTKVVWSLLVATFQK